MTDESRRDRVSAIGRVANLHNAAADAVQDATTNGCDSQ